MSIKGHKQIEQNMIIFQPAFLIVCLSPADAEVRPFQSYAIFKFGIFD